MPLSSLPLIGITCELKAPDPRRPYARRKEIQVLNREYSQSVERAGGMPLPIPIFAAEVSCGAMIQNLDGLILSGGDDVVAPGQVWKGNPACVLRSRHETILLQAAKERLLPVLGICRGLQQINVFFGGTLWDDLPARDPGSVDHRRGKRRRKFRHNIILGANSKLAAALENLDQLKVNSSHHQSAREVGSGLRVVAQAEDGVIEALEGTKRQIIWAVQWHPERLGEHPAGDGLLRQFISLCAAQKT